MHKERWFFTSNFVEKGEQIMEKQNQTHLVQGAAPADPAALLQPIYAAIAQQEGISPEEVRQEMQAALCAAWQHPAQENAAMQQPSFCDGGVPTVEEFLATAALLLRFQEESEEQV
jgi:hypothetical protein